MKKIHWRDALPWLMLSSAVTLTMASAYFMDSASLEKGRLSTAQLSFSLLGADLGELDSEFFPLEEEELPLVFSAVYDGDVEAIAVPRLRVTADNMTSSDIISILDERNEREIGFSGGEALIYADVLDMQQGSSFEGDYTLAIKRHDSEEPLKFHYEFTLAYLPYEQDSELLEKTASTIYEEIASGREGGFSGVTDYRAVIDNHGLPAAKSYYDVRLTPEITDANSETEPLLWYLGIDGEERKLDQNGDSLTLVLNQYNAGSGVSVRYEAQNEAGYVTSETYTFTVGDDGLSAEAS